MGPSPTARLEAACSSRAERGPYESEACLPTAGREPLHRRRAETTQVARGGGSIPSRCIVAGPDTQQALLLLPSRMPDEKSESAAQSPIRVLVVREWGSISEDHPLRLWASACGRDHGILAAGMSRRDIRTTGAGLARRASLSRAEDHDA
jgi:hypothetical protein